jgi:ADP-heptose:LPS heptosyltransferase
MAPAAPAAALLGPGASSVDAVLDWDDPALLALFTEQDSSDAGVATRLGTFDACIAYTGRESLVARLDLHIARTIPFPPQPDRVHAAEWLATPATALGAHAPLIPPDLQPTPTEEGHAAAFLGDRLAPGFLAIHPGSGGLAKNWPRERYAALARELGDRPWLLVEGPAEEGASALLAQTSGCVRARHLSLRALGAILRHSGLFVGNDSGVTHLAAAWGTPTLALFGPTDPALWSPVGRRVALVRSPTPAMEDLGTDAVVAAARRLRADTRGPLR